MTNETKAWLEDLKANGGLSDEAYNSLKNSVENNPKADEHIKGSVLRQSDYSRQSAEIQKAKKEAEDALRGVTEKETALNKFQGELATWKAGAEGSFTKALADSEKANNQAAKALQRLKTVQTKYGIPDEDVTLEGIEIPEVHNVNTNQNPNGPKYTTEEDLKRIVGGGLSEAGILDATIHDLSVKHQELFGTPLRDATTLVKEALASGKPLTQYYAEKYKTVDREKALSEEQYQARLHNDVEAELAKRLSSANLPGMGAGNLRPDLPQSPVKMAAMGGHLNVPTEEGGGLSAAIAAFQAGKYSTRR